MATSRLSFSEAQSKFGFNAKRTKDYRVIDEFGIDISKHTKVMSMGGGLYAIDEFGIDITSRVEFQKI